MSFQFIKKNIARNLVNFSGWQTKRKIIVIESDDWGSIRMPSIAAFEKLIKSGIRIDKDPYGKFDSLESPDDLSELFSVLQKHSDRNCNNPILTANSVVANPDFEMIKKNNFKYYYYKSFKDTYSDFTHTKDSFTVFQQGIQQKLVIPQFHGREHLNIKLWLEQLRLGNEHILKAFELGMWGLNTKLISASKINIQASFDALFEEEIEKHKLIIKEGLDLFKITFGFQAKSFIANNYIWDSRLNKTLYDNGIEYIQGMKYQITPILNNKNRTMIRHKIGEKNEFGQVYLIRNCVFEPSIYQNVDSVKSCLCDIHNAFFWNKPAIISTHRINFIGSLIRANRENNLVLFNSLLSKILEKWPDVEFMSSDQLGREINSH